MTNGSSNAATSPNTPSAKSSEKHQDEEVSTTDNKEMIQLTPT
jgi:hypothetical protein